jgi:hypothetical protein
MTIPGTSIGRERLDRFPARNILSTVAESTKNLQLAIIRNGTHNC